MRKLWCLAEAAVLGIVHALGRGLDGGDDLGRNPAIFSGKGFRLRNRVLNHPRLLNHVAALFLVGIGDAEQHTPKAGAAVSVLGWKVCSAVERFAIGSKKRGQRPSA